MSDWPLLRGGTQWQTAGIVTSGNTQLTAVTSGGSANTQTATAVELIAATAFEANGFWLYYWGDTSDGTRNAIQLFIGAGGSELPLTPELLLTNGPNVTTRDLGRVWIPLAVPLGSRISMKNRSSGTSKTMRVGLMLRACNPTLPPGFTRMTAYGYVSGTTTGTNVVENASANVKGTAVDMTASSSRPCKALMLAVQGLGAITTEQHWTYDIIAGGVVVVPDLPMVEAPSVDCVNNGLWGPYEVDIPAGVALSVACQADRTDAPNNACVLYGLD